MEGRDGANRAHVRKEGLVGSRKQLESNLQKWGERRRLTGEVDAGELSV